jgi:phosphoribosylglycinamide formyltransferase-1
VSVRIGWFSTGRDEAACDLLKAVMDAIEGGTLDGQIAFVFSNRERGEFEASDAFLDLVQSYGLPLITLSSRRYRREQGGDMARAGEPLPAWRYDFDREVRRLVEPYGFDVAMLAGYMLVFTDVMCDHFSLLNLHPAAPVGPVGMWQDVIWQLIEQGADETGVMIFLCTVDVDRGPPVTYCTYGLRGPGLDDLWAELEGRPLESVKAEEGEDNRLFREIRRRGVARELPLVVATLRAFADGRVYVREGRILSPEGGVVGGYDLTPEIEAAVGQP